MEAYVHDAVQDMQMARDVLTETLEGVQPQEWGKFVPYGSRTLHDVLAHIAAADHTWALAAKGLLRGEGADAKPITPEEARAARERAVKRGRQRTPAQLIEEMHSRRQLLLSLFELLEPRHLALSLPAFGAEHNSVRERIWLGYHDRLHLADVRRAREQSWYPQNLKFLPAIQAGVDALAPDESLYVIYSVDAAAWELPSVNPGWTNRQLLAHIATGDWVLQGHLRHIIETDSVDEWPDVEAGNAERVGERQYSPDRALIDEYLSMRHETLLLLSQLKPKHLELTAEFWWQPRPNRHTILDYVLMFSNHDRRHRTQLRPAMKYARSMR
ncbi:MAG: DinB family protein [Dehalococcoidia bacterium]